MESLKEKFLDNWLQRSQQEQIILAVVACLVICGLLFLFVFEPISSAKAKQQQRLENNNRILTEVNSLASQIKSRETSHASSSGTKGSLAVIVDKSLQDNGLNMQGFQPGKNNDARLRLSNIAYKPLAKWLHDLEYRHRVTVQDLSVSQSKTPGLLMVSVRLKQ